MCFIIKTNIKHKAETDIICFKAVELDMSPFFADVISERKEILINKYELKKLYDDSKRNNILTVIIGTYADRIDIGFHSYKTRPDRSNHIFPFFRRGREYLLAEAIIPKGAYYYINDDEYVSDQIILTKMINK